MRNSNTSSSSLPSKRLKSQGAPPATIQTMSSCNPSKAARCPPAEYPQTAILCGSILSLSAWFLTHASAAEQSSSCAGNLWDGANLSKARIPLAEDDHPGCVGRGLDLDLRVRQAASAASGNLGMWKSCNSAPSGSGSTKRGFRTAWHITNKKIRGLS